MHSRTTSDTPESTHTFGRALNETTNSNKFFWMQALLSVAETGREQPVPIRELIAGMLAAAWHLVLLHRLSLGTRDMLQHALPRLQDGRKDLRANTRTEMVQQAILASPTLDKLACSLGHYVPTRFLAPWFEGELRALSDGQKDKKIRMLAAKALGRSGSPPYALEGSPAESALRFDAAWLGWMRENVIVLRAFTDQGLAQFLQARNPGVPGIPL